MLVLPTERLTSARSAADSGATMEDYEPIKVLGEGSFGKVYLMKHKQNRSLVCTKVIKLKNIPKKEQEACRHEVDLLRRMVHPNIVGYKVRWGQHGLRSGPAAQANAFCPPLFVPGLVSLQELPLHHYGVL